MLYNGNEYKKYFIDHINFKNLPVEVDTIIELFNNDTKIKECYEASKKLNIGAAILVKNQEEKIVDAIKSVSYLCEKVVVCDTGSTDSTVSNVERVMEKYRVELVEFQWEENFSKMRNKAASFLDTDWILFIDSDEVVTEKIDIDKLKFCLSFLEKILLTDEIVLCFRQEAEGIVGNGYPQRLYKNSTKISFVGYVHEELRSPNMIDIKTNFTVFNKGTSYDELIRFDKEKRYDTLLLKNIEKEPNNIKWVSLLSANWLLNNISISYNMVNRLVADFKSNYYSGKEFDYFDMKLFMNYIIILIHKGVSREEIESEIQFSKRAFLENPIFYYYEYILKIRDMEKKISECISDLRGDISAIKKIESDEWDMYFPLEALECIMIQLLMKSRHYEIAYNLYMRESKILATTGLVEEEKKFFEFITNKDNHNQ